ncbi:MAG TPA: hypothetical protein VJ912_01270 [Candidatus Nanoarchaeia archaeon]|nr:hypothetical protein [Candidatus Nanoarchaeia archaeon]
MEDINKDNLEKALNGSGSEKESNEQTESSGENPQVQNQEQKMSREMEIGFHQGAINTLNKERSELIKMAQNVESIMQAHAKRLQELGIDLQFQGKKPEGSQESQNN